MKLRNDFIYAPQNLVPGKRKNQFYVFLAGPIRGATDWRNSEIPKIPGVIFLNPERPSGVNCETFSGSTYSEQVDWETLGLRMSDIVLFWIPKSIPGYNEPGRYYAQTTKFELAENLIRYNKKRLIIGIDPEIELRKYIVEKVKAYRPDLEVYETLDDTLKCLNKTISDIKSNSNLLFFTSDTHFGSKRILKLRKRPFSGIQDMNLSLIERWNSIVPPEATVIHLGDFGDIDYRKYLNGNINLICGNYELSDYTWNELDEEFQDVKHNSDIRIIDNNQALFLSHKYSELPMTLQLEYMYYQTKNVNWKHLYGHTHGLHMIRKSGLDVGVDCHNYTPMSIDDVKFYLNSIDYVYDDEVFKK